MLTVLDRFVSRLLEEYRRDTDNLPPAKRIQVRRTVRGTPTGRLQAELRESLNRSPIGRETKSISEQDSWNDLQRLLAPFLLPELCHLPTALDITRAEMDLLHIDDLLAGCDTFFNERSCLYVHASRPIGDDVNAHLGAVFVNREANGSRTWGAILSKDDGNSFLFLKWAESGNRILVLPSHSIGSHDWKLGNLGNLISYCFLLGLSAINYYMNPEANDAVYAGTGDHASTPEAVPHVTTWSAQRVSGLEGFGLFRLIEVKGGKAPAIATTLGSGDRPQGRTLTHKVTVREHGRWQACGPQWSLRKWITVRSFTKGPADAPEDTRIPMTRIKSPVRQ